MASAAQLRTLLGVKQPGQPGRIVVWDTEEISVGRSPENDVVVDDSDASRRHALFARGHADYTVQDLGTANGTLVNKTRIQGAHTLTNKDVVRIGELQLTFIQTRKDPAGLGLELVYASQLKGFGVPAGTADPGATTLGLLDPAQGKFDVGAVGDDIHAPQAGAETLPPATRDLDLEFNDFTPGEALPSARQSLSLTLEIEGLGPELQRTLEGLLDKTIELPELRIRLKSSD